MEPVLDPKLQKKKQVLFLCGREPAYPRNAMILSILNQHFVTTTITNDSIQFFVRYLNIMFRFLLMNKANIDMVYVGFLGQPLMPLVRLFWRGPILFDAFLSVYDTLCFDRKRVSPISLAGRLAFWIDQFSCKLADKVILDTQAHADYFQQTFHIPKEKLAVVFVGCDESIFSPLASESEADTILFYGAFLPLQGVDIIVSAAALLVDTPIRFRIIGGGMETRRIERQVQQLGINNITFLPWVPLDQLPCEIARAAICLGGHFGTSDKAKRVIASKTFQCIAMGKPTIVGDNAANGELLSHGKDAWFCEMGNPQALAHAIQTLLADTHLRDRLGYAAHTTYLRYASKQALDQKVVDIVNDLVG